jgi:excisionase family DNA binding protein
VLAAGLSQLSGSAGWTIQSTGAIFGGLIGEAVSALSERHLARVKTSLRFVGDIMVIETTDLDELRREVARALGDEPLSVQEAAKHLKVSVKTIRKRIKDGTLRAKMVGGAGYRIQKRNLEQIQTDI